MGRLREILLYSGLALALLAPRLPGLDSFATVDEPYWLSMGANFYYALGQREFQNTIYEYQPAVTTMWIVTAALLIYFPEYRGLGQGYLEFEKGLLDPFLLEHGRDPLILLREARLLQVLLIVVLLLLVFYLARRLVGTTPALLAVMITAFDPFFLGHSRLLDHEAMLGVFCLISVLSLLMYLFQDRRLAFLFVSAVSAALAQLTKSSGLALLVPVGSILLLHLYEARRGGAQWREALAAEAKVLGGWLAILAAAYFIFWPGMWVAPGDMLYQVYGNALSYAFRGARLIALDDGQIVPLNLDTDPGGLGQVMQGILWHTTPLTWIGVFLGIVWLFTRDLEPGPRTTRWLSAALIALAGAFILMFGLAQGRNSPHYTLSSYVGLGMLAGLGWYQALEWLSRRAGGSSAQRALAIGMAAILVLQAGSALRSNPYYFTYENPVLARLAPRQFPQFAYGEGLELAARYMAALPDAPHLTALVYYSRGSFSYFFPGQTERFKPYYVDEGHEQDLKKALAGADYLVIYYAVQGHLEKYAPLLGALSAVQPEDEIWLNGYKYAIIYRLDSVPPDVYAEMVE